MPQLLFLEVKNLGYTHEHIATLWKAVESLRLEQHVVLWAMDAAHYDIVKTATGGKALIIWGYNDQDFSDAVSTVPFPAPVPPPVLVCISLTCLDYPVNS